ncbi:MAG: hypothetical protein EOM24_07320, partial [Chloroflexia bacterium]|nr:hypothetical protein [Chloroflexia bacterium]
MIGDDCNLTRGFGEDDDSYRARLLTAWTFWKWSGTALGIVISMQPSGFVGIPWDSTETEFNPYYPNTTSSVFVIRNSDVAAGALLDSGYQFWSRFWVYIDSDLETITYDGIWSDPGDYDDGGVWDLEALDGATITPSMVGAWKAAIRQSKPAAWSCASINVGGTGDVPGGLVQIPMDSYDLTLGLGERAETTWYGQILDIVNWHAASGSLTMETGKTKYYDATFVLRCGPWSAWYRRIFAIESVPLGIRFVGVSTLSAGSYLSSGCEIASEESALAIYTGGAFDIQAKLNATTNVLTFEAKGPAAG